MLYCVVCLFVVYCFRAPALLVCILYKVSYCSTILCNTINIYISIYVYIDTPISL